MLWYPAENISVLFLFLGFRLTNSDFWRLISGDFLGLNLNAMPAAILPRTGRAGGGDQLHRRRWCRWMAAIRCW